MPHLAISNSQNAEPPRPEYKIADLVRLSGLVSLAVFYGLITGVVEGGLIFLFQKYVWTISDVTYLAHSPQILWVAPLVDIVLFGSMGVITGMAAMILPRPLVARALIWLLTVLMCHA